MKPILFIDRDGTLIREAPPTYQIDSFDKLEFYPEVFKYMSLICADLDFELVMVTNQDGMGTQSFPEDDFWPVHRHIIKSFQNEGVSFHAVHIDRSFAKDNHPNRKPGIGMLQQYLTDQKYDIPNSFVIGDRITDVMLAKNLGCKAIWLKNEQSLGSEELSSQELDSLANFIALETQSWKMIYDFLKLGRRKIEHARKTNETEISVVLDLDGSGKYEIETGLKFFNHMLEQLSRHSSVDLFLNCKGDLQIDEHHTIEDTAIALGEAFSMALGNKLGIERYGFTLPMDDSLATVAVDFGGRSWLVWNAEFRREKIGDTPTEMFYHFFKSFSDAARCNINIAAEGDNEHHKIESIFKAFAKTLRMAVRREAQQMQLPSTKGVL